VKTVTTVDMIHVDLAQALLRQCSRSGQLSCYCFSGLVLQPPLHAAGHFGFIVYRFLI